MAAAVDHREEVENLQRRLQKLEKEPPADWHNPKRGKRRKGKKNHGPRHKQVRSSEERAREEHGSLKKLVMQHAKPKRQEGPAKDGFGHPVDTRQEWRRRMAVYGASKGGESAYDEVPKTISVARCSASGAYGFRGGGGKKLVEDGELRGVYYCRAHERNLRELDKVARQREREHARTGRFRPAPDQEEAWIVSRFQRRARDAARGIVARGEEDPDWDAIFKSVNAVRRKEAEARQRKGTEGE